MPKSKKELKETEDKKKTVKTSTLKATDKKKDSKKTDKKGSKKPEKKAIKKVEKKSESKTKKVAKKDTKKVTDKTKKTSKTTKKSVSSAKKSVKKASEKKATKKQEYLTEYYDLPYKYNETVVKILFQTPKRLFVYWEVSEKDKETYRNAFGEDFFNQTYPVLLVHNEELNYTFEIPINDFANSWYLDIKDPKTKYVVQLGRKFRDVKKIKVVPEVLQKEHINLQNDFVYITDSNKLEVPNDHILFEKMPSHITYRNVKTGEENQKDISEILEKLSENYKESDLKEIYKELYGDEISDELMLTNPSSGALTSSSFK